MLCAPDTVRPAQVAEGGTCRYPSRPHGEPKAKRKGQINRIKCMFVTVALPPVCCLKIQSPREISTRISPPPHPVSVTRRAGAFFSYGLPYFTGNGRLLDLTVTLTLFQQTIHVSVLCTARAHSMCALSSQIMIFFLNVLCCMLMLKIQPHATSTYKLVAPSGSAAKSGLPNSTVWKLCRRDCQG